MRFLVTAGNTREKIDEVRDWGNVFTGKTGYAIARALCEIGEVDLLTSSTTHLSEIASAGLPLRAFAFNTHAQLVHMLDERMTSVTYDGIFMSAAVSDYRPTGVYSIVSRQKNGDEETWTVRSAQAPKVKSTHPSIAIVGEPTEKIVDLFRTRWNHRGLLVKFKLEVGIDKDELLRIAQASRKNSQADYVVANTLEMVSSVSAGAYLVSDAGAQWIPRAELPKAMVKIAREPRNASKT